MQVVQSRIFLEPDGQLREEENSRKKDLVCEGGLSKLLCAGAVVALWWRRATPCDDTVAALQVRGANGGSLERLQRGGPEQ